MQDILLDKNHKFIIYWKFTDLLRRVGIKLSWLVMQPAISNYLEHYMGVNQIRMFV